MNLDPYLDAITESLVAAAELGDEQTRRTAAALTTAVAAPARLAVLRALSDMAAEVSKELGDRVVTVRLDGSAAVLEVHTDAPTETTGTATTFEDVTGDISRVTLRLVEQIKARAEEAAAQNGVSLNSWVSQAVQGRCASRCGISAAPTSAPRRVAPRRPGPARPLRRNRPSARTVEREAVRYIADARHPKDEEVSPWPSAVPAVSRSRPTRVA
ncbi:toxin-antitoxin system HicB family antitoxin [Rhodococcus aetherivorans]